MYVLYLRWGWRQVDGDVYVSYHYVKGSKSNLHGPPEFSLAAWTTIVPVVFSLIEVVNQILIDD